MEQIKELVLNKEAYDFCRSSAFRALNFAVIGGIVSREEMLDFYGSLFTGDEAEPGSDFWSFVASAVYELYPEELMDVIKQAYQNDLIWSGYIGLDSFEQALKQGKEQTLAESGGYGKKFVRRCSRAYVLVGLLRPATEDTSGNCSGGDARSATLFRYKTSAPSKK